MTTTASSAPTAISEYLTFGSARVASTVLRPSSITRLGFARVVSSSTAVASESRARSISAWMVSASRATAPPLRWYEGQGPLRMGPAGVYPSGMESSTLNVGDVAPPFTLPDADGTLVSLSDFAGRPVIVYFYPAAMTPGCTAEACDFTSARTPLDS